MRLALFFELEDKRQPLSGSFNLSDLQSGAAIPEEEIKAGVQRPQFVQRLLTLRLDNNWLVRSGTAGEARELAHLNLIQPYNLLFDDADFVPIGPTPDPDQLETEPGEPLMPIILDGGIAMGGLNASTELRYHHQLQRFTSRTISLSGASPRAKMSASLTQNLFSYFTPDGKLNPEGSRLRVRGLINANSSVSIGYKSTINLRDQEPPLDRRLEAATLFVDYHPGCCTVRLTYSEDLEVTQVNGVSEHFINRQILLTFTLGGVVSIETSAAPFGRGF